MSFLRTNSMILMVGVALMLPAPTGAGQSVDATTVTKVKAAFLYNFGKFVAWPDERFIDPQSPIVIGVLGDESLGKILERTIRGKTARARTFVVKSFKTMEAVGSGELRSCHILYVSSSENDHFGDIVKRVAGAHVLTVGEGRNFVRDGGVVAFRLQKEKLGIYVNREQAADETLKISAKLLRRAIIVKPGSRSGELVGNGPQTLLASTPGGPSSGRHVPARGRIP